MNRLRERFQSGQMSRDGSKKENVGIYVRGTGEEESGCRRVGGEGESSAVKKETALERFGVWATN